MSPDKKSKKPKFIERLAAKENVAISLDDGAGRTTLSANNNSICRVLLASEKYAPECAKFCGRAFAMAEEGGGRTEYECHAGLFCRASIVSERGRKYVAIVGRTFLKPENYRRATERAISGDWQGFRPTEFFENVLITGSTEGIDNALARLEAVSARNAEEILDLEARPMPATPEIEPAAEASIEPVAKEYRTIENLKEWRSFFGRLMSMDYLSATVVFLKFASERFKFRSAAWFEVEEDVFRIAAAVGEFEGRTIELGVTPSDMRIRRAASLHGPFSMKQRGAEGGRTLTLFPVAIGTEVRAALGVEGSFSDAVREAAARSASDVTGRLEILRLRGEVLQHNWLAKAVRRFNESLNGIDAEDFWTRVTQVSAELLQAERASLLVRVGDTEDLRTRAAIGARTNLLTMTDVGSRISGRTLERGQPLLVSDLVSAGFEVAPAEWNYRTSSFISFPLLIGERRLGVLNFTDKASGEKFGKRDLDLLRSIAPQIAVAIDRTRLKYKVGEFEQLSVTDDLTGLLNRRYLQERLQEELNRAKRYRTPMTLLMIDVDKFKPYNDTYGHQAGDEALRIVSNVLKENLRGEDVAVRYGGEEFAVLLPQTPLDEASQIAERIRRQIERTQFPHRSVTVSIGLADCTAEIESPDDLIWAADRALYTAKDRGRNNVRVFDAANDKLGNIN